MGAKAPKPFGPIQAARETGLPWDFAVASGLVPAADVDGKKWSPQVVAEAKARAEQIREQLEAVRAALPVGATRTAEAIAQRTGLEVTAGDVETLAERGLLAPVDEYKGHPLYAVEQAAAIPGEIVAEVVQARQAWLETSMTTEQALDRLGWHYRELMAVAAERGLVSAGRRWGGADIEALAQDEELCARVEADRLLGPDQAAAHLEIRRKDLDYLVAGGLIAPADHLVKPVGRRSEVEIPLYRTGDLAELREDASLGIDWEALRAVRPGAPSPLREIVAGLPPSRAALVRAFAAEIGERFGVEVWPRYWSGRQLWEIDWEQRADGGPTLEEVKQALAEHPAGAHTGHIDLSTEVGDVIRHARAAVEPGVAVVLDTETTGLEGAIVEIAIIDAATGEALLDTLVHPGEVEMEPGAQRVHGITTAMLDGAPAWDRVWPRVAAAIGGRTILAYNADFDRGRIRADCARYGIDPGRLATSTAWRCLMEDRSVYTRVSGWMPLGGGHRALGDAAAALELLRGFTAAPAPPARR
ncbi:3'-5' exonuclease [Marinactinospora rubrisoli]|uniref:3'-5' exonuclease n=1 Tax=Marinactinospora rubrisoli TaxID=2715399 RepID=A0ABW2KMY7_9ACTN